MPTNEKKGNAKVSEQTIAKRKKAEKALLKAIEHAEQDRKRLETVLDAVPSAVVIVEASGKFSYLNKRALELYGVNYVGFDLETHITKVKALRPDGSPFPLDEMPVSHSLRAGEEIRDQQMIIQKADGTSIPVLVSSAPLRDGRGKITAAVIIFDDVTERKKVEDSLRRREEEYSSLFDNMMDGFAYCQMIFDEKGKPHDFVYLQINDAFQRITGLKKDLVVGKKVTEAIPGIKAANPELFKIYGKVAQTCQNTKFEVFFKPLGMWLNISVYCPRKGYFAVVFEDISKHKKVEEALKEAMEQAEFERKRLETILETSPSAVVIIEAQSGKFSYVNKRAKQLYGFDTLGLDLDENVAKVKARRLDGTDYPIEEMPVSRSLKLGEEVHNEEMIIERSDGLVIPIVASTAPLRNMQGNITAAIVIFEDITERKNDEQTLRNTERLLSAVTNGSSDAIYVKDRQSRWLFANPALEQIVGRPSAEILGKNDSEIYGNTKSSNAIIENDRRIMASGKPETFEESVDYPDGRHSFISVKAPRFDDNGQVIGIIGISHDITERKKAEEALHESEERFRVMADGSPFIMWMTDTNGGVLFVNRTYREFFGVTFEQVEGGKWQPVIHPDDADTYIGSFMRMVRQHKQFAGEARVRRADGKWRWIESHAEPRFSVNGEFLGHIGISPDITDRKEMQAKIEEYTKNLERIVEERTKQLKDSERLAAIGATAGMVGHDIRNPLQAISSDIYLLKTDLIFMPEGETKENVKESLAGIEQNVAYIDKIVADLQDFARPLTPKSEEIDLKQTIQLVLANLSIPEKVTVEHYVTKHFPALKADPSYMQRILQNLANNAIQAMPHGGTLTIDASTKNGKAIIIVQDTGEGIPESVKSRLFTPLVTTKSKGQGFGLSVVKRFTEALGGTVSFESEVGKGTRFKIELPL